MSVVRKALAATAGKQDFVVGSLSVFVTVSDKLLPKYISQSRS